MEDFVKRVQNVVDAIRRFLNGMFWFPVGKLPGNDEFLIIPGDPDAIPRSNPFWRDQWKWIVLIAPHPAPFLVFFECEAEGIRRRFFKVICTPYAAMRVGPRAIKVVLLSLGGQGQDPMRPDVFLFPSTEAEIRSELASRYFTHLVTWI